MCSSKGKQEGQFAISRKVGGLGAAVYDFSKSGPVWADGLVIGPPTVWLGLVLHRTSQGQAHVICALCCTCFLNTYFFVDVMYDLSTYQKWH